MKSSLYEYGWDCMFVLTHRGGIGLSSREFLVRIGPSFSRFINPCLCHLLR